MLHKSLSAMVGLWLFVSAFLLNLKGAQFQDTWLVGLLATSVAVASIFGLRSGWAINMGLAFWLFLSTLVLVPETNKGVLSHHLVMAVLLLITSLASKPRRVETPIRPVDIVPEPT
jgi:hypothetical protein